jgi:hypothetical protein
MGEFGGGADEREVEGYEMAIVWLLIFIFPMNLVAFC